MDDRDFSCLLTRKVKRKEVRKTSKKVATAVQAQLSDKNGKKRAKLEAFLKEAEEVRRQRMRKELDDDEITDIADTLVNDYFESISETLSEEKQIQTEANIRRRAYDAINVLIAMNIIMKDNREIHWIGLPESSLSESRRLEEERVQTVDRLNQKSEQVKELIIQLVAYKRLIELNREREKVSGKPSEENMLKIPYMILDTPKQAVVDCTSSEDKSEYWLSFSHPFGLYEDVEVLKRLSLSLGLEKNDVSPENVALVKGSLPSALRFYINDEDENGA